MSKANYNGWFGKMPKVEKFRNKYFLESVLQICTVRKIPLIISKVKAGVESIWGAAPPFFPRCPFSFQ